MTNIEINLMITNRINELEDKINFYKTSIKKFPADFYKVRAYKENIEELEQLIQINKQFLLDYIPPISTTPN